MSSRFDSVVAGIKIVLRDVVGPLVGMWLVLQLGLGKFDTAAIPVVAALASALIGIPFWSRADERDRRDRGDGDGGNKRRKRKSLTINWGNGDDEDGDESDDSR